MDACAHIQASINSAARSEGRIVDEVRWCSNQIVNQLAKDAAETVGVSRRYRDWALGCEEQLKELVVYLGKLTHEAISFSTDDGVIRDSDSL